CRLERLARLFTAPAWRKQDGAIRRTPAAAVPPRTQDALGQFVQGCASGRSFLVRSGNGFGSFGAAHENGEKPCSLISVRDPLPHPANRQQATLPHEKECGR